MGIAVAVAAVIIIWQRFAAPAPSAAGRPVEKAAAQRLAICVDACTQSLPQHTGRRLKAKFCRQMNALRPHRDSLRIALGRSVE